MTQYKTAREITKVFSHYNSTSLVFVAREVVVAAATTAAAEVAESPPLPPPVARLDFAFLLLNLLLFVASPLGTPKARLALVGCVWHTAADDIPPRSMILKGDSLGL